MLDLEQPDPPVPADGSCFTCHGRRTAHLKSDAARRDDAERDPFCSSTCARAYYGCPLPFTARATDRQREAARDAAERFRSRAAVT